MDKKNGIFMIVIIISIAIAILTGEYGILLLLILATVLAIIIKIGLKIYDISMKKSELLIPVVTGGCFEIIILGTIFNSSRSIYLLALFMEISMCIFDIVILCKQPKNFLNYIKIIVDAIWLYAVIMVIIHSDNGVQIDGYVNHDNTKYIIYSYFYICCIVARVFINIIELTTGIIKEKKFMYSDYTYIDE